jgi:CheY-like chemotaxis protein
MSRESGPKTIIIADDESSLRLLVSNTLEDERYQIIEALDGADAVAKAERDCPDLIILDLTMPQLSGIEVCRRLKANPALTNLKIIVLTGKGKEDDVREAMNAGANCYLKKPFSPQQLLRTVDMVMQAGNRV